ncbi:glycosyltransferase [Jeongeupia naejangsanensis]|uniref:Glycosyltransferase n=1 Tax=Jeongeupia naejangsanensis TaxID=613195 RepID=A0ABS2BP98_9NEIS|nr:glycosyltransferase [Jeongeupia naejangsanensis]MBM3117235.1 glycosyltransferase [Jeongeupia naejangsanensis]
MNDTQNRLICLIPHYNNPGALVASLGSIGAAEACDVLVVDDGSTRAPIDVAACRSAFVAQGTLRFLNLPQNRGIEHALNAGLEWIRGRGYELVARLDCGDLNVSDRFAMQTAFLDAHPDIALLGGAAEFVDQQGKVLYVMRHPSEHADIARTMRANSAFIHPAVMYRVAALAETGLYPLDTPAAEDYALFWQFVARFRTANLPEVLIRYELDPGGISLSKRSKQLKSRLLVQRRHSDGSPAALAGIARTYALRLAPAGLIGRLKARLRKGRT